MGLTVFLKLEMIGEHKVQLLGIGPGAHWCWVPFLEPTVLLLGYVMAKARWIQSSDHMGKVAHRCS